MSGIGALVKVVDSHLCGWGSIPGKSCNFLRDSVSEGLSLCFLCSDQLVKYPMPCGFPLSSSLLLDYHIKQYIHTHTRTNFRVTYFSTFNTGETTLRYSNLYYSISWENSLRARNVSNVICIECFQVDTFVQTTSKLVAFKSYILTAWNTYFLNHLYPWPWMYLAPGFTKCGCVGESLGSTPGGATVSNHSSGHSTER